MSESPAQPAQRSPRRQTRCAAAHAPVALRGGRVGAASGVGAEVHARQGAPYLPALSLSPHACALLSPDFDLALDLGFLTKNRTYTFFKPKFILYATYLSEKIGYWRYISIYRHLQANPNAQLYPIFQYFENWCQDENRHGDFFTALLKSQPKLVNDWEARIWSRFFCLSVYVTMYLNDHQRSEFYESLGLDTTQFNMHVLHQTNKTTALIFPEVIDTYNPQFKERLDHLVILNKRLIAGISNPLEKISVLASFAGELAGLFFMPTVRGGSIDIESASPEAQAALVY